MAELRFGMGVLEEAHSLHYTPVGGGGGVKGRMNCLHTANLVELIHRPSEQFT